MKKIKNKPKGLENKNKAVKTASILILTLVLALVVSGAASAGTPLAENQTGTVSGDLYVNTTNPWASTTQGATNEVTQANTLPTYTSIDSAMVYVNVYSGSGTSNWPVRTTIKLDGNGDGDYDDTGELLGVEDMNIPGTTDDTVYWLNDHCNRVYSDYQVWYDVKNLITSNNPTLYVKTENMGGDGYDGRIKLLSLVVAYNDGDTDKVDYWVLNGQDWINADTSPSTTTFNTSSFNGQVASATLNTVALSSTDGTYTLNTSTLTGNLTETGAYYKEHQWDVTSNINAGTDTNLTYANVGSSFKINLATLTIREAATTPPEANFTADPTSGTAPLTVNFTNTSTGTITSYAWDFNNDGITDSTGQSPSHTYTNRGTYTVKLTVTGPGGTDTETKTDLINVTGPRTWIVAADGTGDYTTLQAAFNASLLSGDTIYIKEGTYTLTDSITSSLTNITINSAGTDKVTLNMKDTTSGHYLQIDGSGWTIENLRILNSYLTIYGSNCTFKNNIYENGSGPGDLVILSSYNLICNNTFSQPKGNYGCMYIYNGSNYNEIRDNVIIGAKGSYSGMTIYSSYNVVENNTIRDGLKRGLTIYSTGTNNTIRNNSFLNNAVTGIMLSSAGSGNQIYLNTFSGNGATISLSGTKPSNISWVSPSAINYTYNGTQYSAILGNYWGSNYTGLDADNNGIGDTAYTIPSSMGTDTAPLMYPFSGYSIPVADFTATPLSGATPLTISFTDKTPGYISSWAWDFNNDGTVDSTSQNPTCNYTTPGTYTVKLTITNPAGSDDEIKTDYIVIHEADTTAPTVTASPTSETFNPPMQVTLSITDNADLHPVIYYTTDGTDPTTTSTVYTGPITLTETTTLKFIGVDVTGNISPVQSETYTMVDTEAPNATASQSGTTVTLSATDNSDPNPAIYYTTDGTDPTTSSTLYNGPFNIPRPAITLVKFIAVDVSGNVSPVQSRNYTTYYSTDLLTGYYAEGNINVIISNGGTGYGWFAYNTPGTGTVTYTASSLNIPAGATILSARLYQAWTWYGCPGYTLQFNGQNVPVTIHYPDGNDGQDVFDVTSYFNANGDNTAVLTSGGGASYATILIVVYQSASEPYRKIWVNEGFDIIPSYSGYGATEGPGHAFFDNVTTTNIGSAQIITSLPSGNNDSPNILLNGQTFTINSTDGSDPSYKYYNINPAALQNGLNTLEVPNMGYMSISNAILTLTMTPADLTINNLQTNNPQVGTNSPVTVTVTNTGGTDVNNLLVKLYDNNLQVAKNTITSLAAGASAPVNFNWTPATTGNHVLAVIADAGNLITESDETNNLVSAEVTVSPSAQPDLLATNLQLPVSPVIGTSNTVTATVTNLGTVDSSAFVVKLYDNNTQYATVNLTGLAAGASTDVTFNWLSYTSGAHNLSVIADANQQISEYNEVNNQISQQATVSQSTQPDLTVTNLQVPASPAVAVNSQLTATVTNLGTVDSGAFVVKLYDNNIQIAKINLMGLAEGTSTDVTFNWTTFTAGNHNLSVITDANQQISEFNENNNQISQQTTVSPATQPDLTVTDLQLPSNPVAGTTYQVTATVTNLGTVDAGTFAVKLYDNNTQLGKINITSLAAGTSTQVTFNWTPTTGTHNLAIKADANSQISEYNENNNQITQQATVS